MAKLTFYGAVEGVTGSAYLLETQSSRETFGEILSFLKKK